MARYLENQWWMDFEEAKYSDDGCSLCGYEIPNRWRKAADSIPKDAGAVHAACIQAFAVGRYHTYQGKHMVHADEFAQEIMMRCEAKEWFREYNKKKSAKRKAEYAGVTKKDMPDLVHYFNKLNKQFFNGEMDISNITKLKWCFRMTRTAGYCTYRFCGGQRAANINMSGVFHPHSGIKDMESTLAHEMVHAHLWIKDGFKGHGDKFINFMDASGISEYFELKTRKQKVFHNLKKFNATRLSTVTSSAKTAAMERLKNTDYQRGA